jgi:transposase
MRKILEVLRLRYEVGLRQEQIARSCQIGQATVHRYLDRFAATRLGWPLPEDCDEVRLERALFPTRRGRLAGTSERRAPDFVGLHNELQKHKNVTLQLLWEEYRAQQSQGYGYSRFCELYGDWKEKLDVVLRQEHRAGEKLFVDWAGTQIPIFASRGGETDCASLFVAVLGASSYTFLYAAPNQELRYWID